MPTEKGLGLDLNQLVHAESGTGRRLVEMPVPNQSYTGGMLKSSLPTPNKVLLQELCKIAQGLGETFAPFCEVVVHDLNDPKNAIVCIENNLSGRVAGQPATELGLARINDPNYPEVIANYFNEFADGRKVKSTSIGIKDETGKYAAALCLNVDLTLFQGFQAMLGQFAATSTNVVNETLDLTPVDRLIRKIDEFAANRATTARALPVAERKRLLQELKKSGLLEIRRGAEIAAAHMGISRATVYNGAK